MCYAPLYPLSDDIQLTFKSHIVVLGEAELSSFRLRMSHKQLLDGGFHPTGSLTQHLGAGRHRAQVHQLQALALYLFYHHRQDVLLLLLVFGQKHQSRAVLALLGNGNALQQNKLMGYLDHDARTVARLVSGLGTSVLHVLQHAQRLVHQFVALATMYVHHHAYAAGVVLIL